MLFAAWLVAATSPLGRYSWARPWGWQPALPLSAAGWIIAVYHFLLVQGVIPEAMVPCRQEIPCSRVEIEWLGFVTIPLLSVVAFSIITLNVAMPPEFVVNGRPLPSFGDQQLLKLVREELDKSAKDS